MIKASNRDWPEDFSQENGNYKNACVRCGEHFHGNKRRLICKVCAAKPKYSELEAQLAEANAKLAAAVGALDEAERFIRGEYTDPRMDSIGALLLTVEKTRATLPDRAARLLKIDEILKNCAEFVKWALQEGPWQGCDLDGGSVQDKAEELGLIAKTKYDSTKHGELWGDYESGDEIYVLSPALAAVQP